MNYMTKQSYAKHPAIMAVAILSVSLLLAGPLRADDLTVTKEVVLDSNSSGNSITITRANNDGLLITSDEAHAAHKALVLRTDHAGNVKWRYETGLLDPPWAPGATPTYHGAVVMSDGSSIECGTMPRQDAGFRPNIGGHFHQFGLLTHLDRDGKLIEDKVLLPHDGPHELGTMGFFACANFGDGIVAIGTTNRVLPNHELSDREYLYWIVAFDSSGKIKWEKLQPTSKSLSVLPGPLYISPLQIMPGGGFVFAAAHDIMGSTSSQVLHIGPRGDVVASVTMDGLVTIAPQEKAPNQVALVSLGTVGPTTSLIVLDDQLHELHRNSVKRHRSFETAAFLLPHQTLILFGSKPVEGPLFLMKASVAKVDAVSGNENDLFVADDKANYNWIKGAAAMTAPGSFAAVRIVTPTDLVLDFIQVK
jgi:hypothetical protein